MANSLSPCSFNFAQEVGRFALGGPLAMQGQACDPGCLSHLSFPTLHLRYLSLRREASLPFLLRKGMRS